MTLGIGAATEPPVKPPRVSFVLRGVVVPKARPRFTNRGVAYTPAKTRQYETAISHSAKVAMIGRQMPLGAVVVSVEAVLAPPRSWSAKKRQDACTGAIKPHGSRADLDNIAKSVLDAGNGILWKDDRQICTLVVIKVYGPEPLLRVEVEECTSISRRNTASSLG